MDDDVMVAVVDEVAATLGCEPFDLPPLAETIDPDALEQMWSTTHGSRRDADLEVSFLYAGCRVLLRDGQLPLVSPMQPPQH